MIYEPTIERVPVSWLVPSPYNPRRISDEALSGLRASIKRFGLVVPILVNKNYQVIGGHQRLRIVKESGAKETTVVVVDLSDTEEKALNVSLNSPHLMGQYIEEDLSELLENLGNEDVELFRSLRLDVFTDTELAQLTENISGSLPASLENEEANANDIRFLVTVEVDSPDEQIDLYNRLNAEGYRVQVQAR